MAMGCHKCAAFYVSPRLCNENPNEFQDSNHDTVPNKRRVTSPDYGKGPNDPTRTHTRLRSHESLWRKRILEA